LCGQPLTEEHRASTLEMLGVQGKEMGDQWRANKNVMETLTMEIKDLEARLKGLADAENERVRAALQASSLAERLEMATNAVGEWESGGKLRFAEVEGLLSGETFAGEARSDLSKIDGELSALGYDAAAHDAARLAEQDGRSAETDFRALEAARAALAPLEREIGELRSQIEALKSEIAKQDEAFAAAATSLDQAEQQAPDLAAAERAFLDMKEQEMVLNQQVGMARQLVTVLESRRAQKRQHEAQREELAVEIGRHKTLERAFGKDGVPALLIEQALPQIEEKANELLDRLSNGTMSVRFVTQAEYKDKKREDLRETLDIQISDGAGMRDYEMFSGGEAFRVNFAIRLALSEVLARRTGARLQTLVIDEGFGSQDAQGRQRLIEAINTVRKDFAKILIITHLEELKEAFPNRIEVEKTPRGSTVQVI
jgi:exonuclease SbcC